MAAFSSIDDAVRHHATGYPDLAPDLVAHEFQRRRVLACTSRVRPGDRVLEVGCNSGFIADYCQQAAEIHGVDVNPVLVARAAQRLTSARVAQAEALPFADASFDVVNLSGVLELVFDPAIVLREAARVARRVIIGNVCHADGGWGTWRVPSHTWHLRAVTEDELRVLLSPCGRIVEISTVDAGGQPQCFMFEVAVEQI